MRILLASAAALSLLAAAPVLAAPRNVHGACAPSGGFVVKPGTPLTQTPTTPVGILGGFEEPVGDFYVDLSGKPVEATATLAFTLSWTNPASDYDLIVNGTSEEPVDNPEVVSLKTTHCKKVTVGIDVFVGLPIDELTLEAKATAR